jgi:hypothetical protein
MSRTAPWILGGLWLAVASAVAAAPVGAVKESRGSAFIERGASVAPAALGAVLEEGDTVRTGDDGAVGLTLTDGSTYALGPGSSLEITRYLFRRGGGSQMLLRLDDGQMTVKSGAIAAQGADRMRIETPTSVVGVRGTYFIVGVDE